MSGAVEIRNLPASVTFDELRSVLDCSAVSIVLPDAAIVGAAHAEAATALVMVADGPAATAACDLLHCSQWGAHTLAVLVVNDVAQWMHDAAALASPAAAGPASSWQQPQAAAAAPPLPPPQAFEVVPDWGWEEQGQWQPAGQKQQGQYQQPPASWRAYHEDGSEGEQEAGWREVGSSRPAGAGGRGGGGSGVGSSGRGGGGARAAGGRAANKKISETPTADLWVGNIGRCATPAALHAVFSRFGALRQWQLQEATLSIAAPPLYGLLRYRRLEDAVAAYNALNKRVAEPLGRQALKIRYRVAEG